MGVTLRGQKVHWVYQLGTAGPATLSIDEDIGEQFAAVSIDRWVSGMGVPLPSPTLPRPPHPSSWALRTLQFGHMSVTVEKQTVHETKGDVVAPGAEGLLDLRPEDFVFYVGGYPSSFMVSPGHQAAGWAMPGDAQNRALTIRCVPSPLSPSASLATRAALSWTR